MSKIEWTDKTWNPVTGCTKVSQGCKNCYAERMYERFNGHGSFKNVTCHQDRLTQPMKWKKPSMIFVNSMSDLFHEDVPFIFIDAVFSVMSDIDHHIYQVLTKRPERMVEFFKWKRDEFGVPWQPKPNVWLGVSVEDQKAAAERIPYLLQVPAAVRFLSCEPLLGPVRLTQIDADAAGHKEYCTINALTGRHTDMARPCEDVPSIHWVICGGESGPGARPMNPNWARSLRDQCASAEVPFFFKQWGEWSPYSNRLSNGKRVFTRTSPEGPEGWVYKVGKKKAGRILDGSTHDQFPGVSIPKKLGI